MEIYGKEVWLLNKVAEEIHYSKWDMFRTQSNAPFLNKLFHYNREEGLRL